MTDLKCNILAIGDSNGQNKGGWVDQLKKMMPESNIVNLSESGRTIGFDNNGRERLNALKNIEHIWIRHRLRRNVMIILSYAWVQMILKKCLIQGKEKFQKI